MSERGSFWSTVPGVVTGAAGVLTALVGLLTACPCSWDGSAVAIPAGGHEQYDDGGSGREHRARASARARLSPARRRARAPAAARSDRAVEGGTVQRAADVGGLRRRRVPAGDVVVRNTGEVPLTIKTPTVSGSGAAHFVAGDVSCTKEAAPARSDLRAAGGVRPQVGGAVSAVAVIAAAEARGRRRSSSRAAPSWAEHGPAPGARIESSAGLSPPCGSATAAAGGGA